MEIYYDDKRHLVCIPYSVQNLHRAALEFHHKNPEDKDFAIGGNMNRGWEFVKKELYKCILLCSNCHRIQHNKYEETSSLVKEATWSAKPTE